MTQTEARLYVAEQNGVDVTRLSALLDSVSPSTLEGWAYITGQIGHASPQELRASCVLHGAFVGEQS
jgi:hypothetical protein